MDNGKEFQWYRQPFMLAPYTLEAGIFTSAVLVEIYDKLHREGLYPIVFHDNPDMDLLRFMNFFSSYPSVLLQVVQYVDDAGNRDIAAISWLAGLESYADGYQRATGSFCVFRDYQTPIASDAMAKLVLSFWFTKLKLDIVVGMSPAENRLAVRFEKRIGFQELCRIPNYSAYSGKRSDCVVTHMDKARYIEVYGG